MTPLSDLRKMSLRMGDSSMPQQLGTRSKTSPAKGDSSPQPQMATNGEMFLTMGDSSPQMTPGGKMSHAMGNTSLQESATNSKTSLITGDSSSQEQTGGKMFLTMGLLQEQTVIRSRSETSYKSLASVLLTDKHHQHRRASDWAAKIANDCDGRHHQQAVVLRPLQLNSSPGSNKEYHSNLLYRRLSKSGNKSPATVHQQSPATSAKEVSRSYSVKSMKKFAEARHRHRGSSIPSEASTAGGVKVKERTVSNRSLPLPGNDEESPEYMRLRNFSVTSKGVINRGDSFRTKSAHSAAADAEPAPAAEAAAAPCSPLRRAKEEEHKEEASEAEEVDERISLFNPYKVLLIGGPGVGKSSLKTQFMTSEYICAYDSAHDHENDRAVNIILNNEESQLEFEEETLQEENAYTLKTGSSEPDAYVVVYSVTHRRSYLQARRLLSQLEDRTDSRAVILVGNKADLARLRAVTTDEGKSLAKDRGCKFIETSVGINHQVDELLVGTLTQIRIKAKMAEKKLRKKRDYSTTSSHRRPSTYTGTKASSVLKRILKRACLKSKSCDNLHVL